MTITNELVPWIVCGACAIFSLGWLLGLTVGKISGENRVMRWYEEREHARRNAYRMMKQKRREDRKARRNKEEK